MKSSAPASSKGNPPSKSPFNPNTLGHAEFIKQLDQRMPSTSVKKNFLPSLGGAVKEAGKIALELPKSVVEPFARPSEITRQVEQRIAGLTSSKAANIVSAVPRALAKGFIRATNPIIESLGTQIGTAVGTGELPSPNDAFLAGGTFGLGLAGSVNIGNAKVKPPYQEKTPFVKSAEPVKTPSVNAPVTQKTTPKPAIAPRIEQLPSDALKGGQEVSYAKTTKGGKPLNPITYKPIEQPQIKVPEIKTSKLARGVEEKAITKKLADGFGDLPEYAQVNVKDQAKAASSLVKTNREQAVNIAMGRELPPEGVLPESVFIAVEDNALKTKDVALLRDLATSSSLTTEATGMGQRIRMLAERNPNSSVAAMRKVMKLREEAATKRYGDVKKARAKVTNEITAEVRKAAPKAKDWTSFLEEIKCR